MTRYTYRLTTADGGYLAECIEISAAGEGNTRDAAISSLRESIVERMSTEAVAPPSHETRAAVELIEAAPPVEAPSPQGPGEA